MKKVILYANLLFSVFMFECKTDLETNLSNVIDSVVTIEVTSISGDRFIGSGFIIDQRGIVVTNDHVIDEPLNIIIRLHDNRIIENVDIGLLYRNQLQDIAVLLINRNGIQSLSIGDPAKYLQDIYVVGHAMGELKTARGKVTSKEEIVLNGFSYIPMDATLDPGFSGAPVVDKKGKVIGIAAKIRGRDLNYAVPIRYVRDVLKNFDDVRPQIDILANNNNRAILFHDNNANWTSIVGDWIKYGDIWAHISCINHPYEEGVYGLMLSDRVCSNFILEAKMRSIARIDGYKNIDIEVVFRYIDEGNFYCYDSYSGEGPSPIWKHDKGGLWKVENGVWELLQVSSLIQEFQNDRWYNVRIIAEGSNIKVCVDNIKCIDVIDNTFHSGRVGYRTTSSHAWFGFLKVFSIY